MTHITNITINNNCPTPMGFGMSPMRPPMFGCSIFSNCFMPMNNSMAAGFCVGTAVSNPFMFKALAFPFVMLGKGAAWTYNNAIKPAANFVWNKALKPAGKFVWNNVLKPAGNFVWNNALKPFGQWVGGLFKK
jgi:hypothetical protein